MVSDFEQAIKLKKNISLAKFKSPEYEEELYLKYNPSGNEHKASYCYSEDGDIITVIYFCDKTEADARAKMLIYLKENKLIK